MSPQQKAGELISKFLKYQNQESKTNFVIDGIDWENAKASAIVCAEEIINEYRIWDEDPSVSRSKEQWIKVKEELEKL